MNYTVEYIDPEKIKSAMKDYRDFQMQEKRLVIEKATSFFEGYEKAIYDVQGMFHCCNYESKGKITAAHLEGADKAFYELCKELGVGCQDIREMNTSIDEKAALIAERIIKVFSEPPKEG